MDESIDNKCMLGSLDNQTKQKNKFIQEFFLARQVVVIQY